MERINYHYDLFKSDESPFHQCSVDQFIKNISSVLDSPNFQSSF